MRSRSRTWRNHARSREDQTLHDRLTAVITAVWPTRRSIAETSPALHPALNLHRHLRTFYGGARRAGAAPDRPASSASMSTLGSGANS